MTESVKVLLVDDDEDLRFMVAKLLKKTLPAVQVIAAASGRAGFDAVLRECPDVVVTDGQMPEMTGPEMIEALRANGHRQPIISLAGVAQTGQQALAAGADFALEKLDFKRLPAVIRGLLARRLDASAAVGV